MKTKFNILLASILSTMFVCEAHSQLKVLPNGNVGVGTNNPLAPLHTIGFIRVSGVNGHVLRLHSNNPTPEIGSSHEQLNFWYSGTIGYNTLMAKAYKKSSDYRLKSDLMIIESPMDKILNLKAYQYNFNQKIIEGEDTIVKKIPEYGFVSQEVKETLKDVAITEEGKEGIILMDYDQIIPLLVAGVQEQQRQISSLEATIAILMSRTPESGNTIDSTEVNSNSDVSRLDNATPNPFSESTSITYRLASNVTTASIKVWDMQGVEKKSV